MATNKNSQNEDTNIILMNENNVENFNKDTQEDLMNINSTSTVNKGFVPDTQEELKSLSDKNSIALDVSRKSINLEKPKQKHWLLRRLYILTWIREYNKNFAISDIIAGVTLGLTMIPQSIAYAALAGLPSQYGLYAAFMGSLVYVCFGTIKEVSIGPTSLMALLTLQYTYGKPVEFAVILAFLAGVVELLMGILKLGFIVDFISGPVTSAFTSATSLIIIGSQIKNLLGIKYSSKGFTDSMINLFSKITETTLGDGLLGLFSIIFLLCLRQINQIKINTDTETGRILKKIIWYISISRNALAVISTSIFAFILSKYSNGSVPFRLSGEVESGVPSFELPPFTITYENITYNIIDICRELGSGIIVVPLVAVLANVAIAKAFTTGGTIDASQEMLTLGLCNLIGSCFRSMPTCGAFTRSAVSQASGVKTPMAGIYSGTMVILALSLLTPYFKYIPKATLAAVLICAVMFMMDFKIIKKLWQECRRDLIGWIGCFVACLILGVEIGLLCGILLNVMHLLFRWARPQVIVKLKEIDNIQYIYVSPNAGIFFPGIDYLREKITTASSAAEYQLPIILDCNRISGLDYTSIEETIIISGMENSKNITLKNLKDSSSKEINNNKNTLYEKDNSIKEFYKNDVIFITGATGFLGKALIEKLLRSCNDLKTIYILIRPKRGISSEERYKNFIRNQVFDRLREEKSSALDKLLYVSGDITQPYLGLNEHDLNFLLDNITIVFHSAATVKFNEGLKEAANFNACGTQRLLDLCLKMPNLKSIVHVSTAFCNPGRKDIGEMVYPPTPPMDKDSFMKCVTILPGEILDSVTKQIMGSHPNTYTLTKSIAENIVYEYSHKLPISIIRPSIVTGAIKEPFPGWVDNVQGITGIMMEAGRGTITSILGDGDLICDIIPVDIVVNTMIGAAWLKGTHTFNQLQVFNCTSGQLRPITWKKLSYYTMRWARINPSKYITLYPNCSYRRNEFIHNIYVIIYQILPAFLIDLFLKFQGRKPLMLKIARKIRDTCQIGKFFALNEWNFDVNNQKNLSKMIQLTSDGNEFNCNIENLDYDEFFRNYMLGIRKYILKDGNESMANARKKLSSLYGIKIFLRGLSFLLLAYVTFKLILNYSK